MSGKLPKLKLGKKGATLVIVTREAAFAISAAETSLSFADARQRLDARLLAHRGAAIGHRPRGRQRAPGRLRV